MGKSRRDESETSRIKRLANENRQLKKQIASLRKLLSKSDLDRSNVKDILEEHSYTEEYDKDHELSRLKEEWRCKNDCNGYLEIILYNKINTTYYYRQCTDCFNRTRSKRYDKNVKGIIKNPL